MLKTPRPEEHKHLDRLPLRRLTEDDVPHLGSASLEDITWSPVSGFKGLQNDVVIVAGVTDIEADRHRGIAYVGMSRTRTRLCVMIHEDGDESRRERPRFQVLLAREPMVPSPPMNFRTKRVPAPAKRSSHLRVFVLSLACVLAPAPGCAETSSSSGAQEQVECDAGPIIRTADEGVEFVRTPSGCFESLPGFDYELQSVDIDGLRQGYVDEGPADAPVVLMLHGQPSWSYLYRKMIPVLVDAGYRAVAMDHVGMGSSDKPIDIAYYSYLGHIDRLEKFIEALGLRDINIFVQDWGSLIGLHVAGENPDWFVRIVVGDGTLPVLPEGVEPYPRVEDPEELDPDLEFVFQLIPAQQFPFYDEECNLIGGTGTDFGAWMEYSMKAEAFHASEVVEALTWFDIPADEEAAYDAPFPSRLYMAGPRTFPSLVNELGGANANAWAGLMQFDRPFLTIWSSNDPGNLGSCGTQDNLIDNVPGAAGLPHTRLPESSHFLQDDQGAEIARRIVELIEST